MRRRAVKAYRTAAFTASLDELRGDASRWEVMVAGYNTETERNDLDTSAQWFSLAWLLDPAHDGGREVSLRFAPTGLMVIARPCQPRENLT